jgi:hypothetical protein
VRALKLQVIIARTYIDILPANQLDIHTDTQGNSTQKDSLCVNTQPHRNYSGVWHVQQHTHSVPGLMHGIAFVLSSESVGLG